MKKHARLKTRKDGVRDRKVECFQKKRFWCF